MEQARTTISKIFNGEPRSYTRFNLTQNMEGDSSHVEMKLSADLDEDVGGNGVGEHRQPNGVHGPYAGRRAGRSPMNVCFLVSATLLLFIIGYLIGYLVHSKKGVAPSCPSADPSVYSPPSEVQMETGAAPLMDWEDVKSLLAEQLSTTQLEKALSDLASTSHRAGSPGDDLLANKVLSRFKAYSMQPWTDEHFVKVQEPNAHKPNQITFNGATHSQAGFLSYSATGDVSGAILYANFGQKEDLKRLQDYDLGLSGRVVLVKAGRISFAEKVANAAALNASAVLIYAEKANELYGHVHLGSGDPYSPGFPSFNHTQFAPVRSSGLPSILAQTISWDLASRIISQLGGRVPPSEWRDVTRLGAEKDQVRVEVYNLLVEKKISNILGVIKGLVDPDRYIILGAQRDAWGPGFAKSTVGTSVLVELARAISSMVKHGGFRPRRSILFASWSAGDYGNVGSTEWLEGYLASLSMRAFSYINLDGVVTGSDGFNFSASPLLQALVENTMKEFKSPNKEGSKMHWSTNLQPMQMTDAAFPFLAFSGIPSISFRFTGASVFPYFDTPLDMEDRLKIATSNRLSEMVLSAAQVAGHMTLRLVHDHLLSFNLRRYDLLIRIHTADISRRMLTLQRQSTLLPRTVTPQWVQAASGSFSRAMRDLMDTISDSDLQDVEMCREINDRFMQVERNLLSPYVSPRDRPFRHIFMGSGPHTFQAILDHLEAFRLRSPEANVDSFQTELALATWTLQGCANSLAGDVWSLDNEI